MAKPTDTEDQRLTGAEFPGSDYLIIFGAAIRRDGRPSATLLHRIEGALACAKLQPSAKIIPTGTMGQFGPAEAEVMSAALQAGGVSKDRIIVEARGRDTLESVRFCHRILQGRGDCRRVICCTSTFHQPRCALLLRLLGYRVALPPMPSSWGHMKRATFAKLVAKEVAAAPYDVVILLARRALRQF